MEYWHQASYLKAGIMFSRLDHHGQPAVRGRNPDARVRVRIRRHPAEPGRPAGRHFERDRLRSMEPRQRPASARPVRRGKPVGKGGRQAARPGVVRHPSERGRHGPAARRHGVAAGGPEGVRSRGRRVRRAARPRCHVRAARHRRRALRGAVARPVGGPSRPRRRAHRIRRGAGAPDRRRQRHVPDAVAVRAVRPEPDVQPALRHGAGGAGHRRAGRHGAGLRPANGRGHRIHLRRVLVGGAARRADGGRSTPIGAPTSGARLQLAGMREDHSWTASAREYVSVYERAQELQQERGGPAGKAVRA